MDIRARDTAWLSTIDTVFGGDTVQVDINESGQKTELKNSMKYLLKKRTRTWWNRASLEKYLAKGLIPRGLRVRIMPSFPVEDTLFRTKWEEVCDQCSKSLMDLLIGNNKKSLEMFDMDIENTRKKLIEVLTPSELEALNKDIDTQFQIWEKEVKDVKTKKFQRDLNDFKSGTVYRWRPTTMRGYDKTRSSSFSSMSSRDDEGEQGASSYVYNLRKNNYRRKGNNRNRRTEKPSSKLQVINLSDTPLSETQVDVLSLGLTFSPVSPFDSFLAVKDLHLFARKLVLKKLHDKSDRSEEWSNEELETLAALEELLEEQNTSPVKR
ncbi:uncharacterized protein [Ranitomeya imitator]|uniref:uncharacterized protein n=1 Tax=Ranitomeya imitator TaxID=111125 RepID=UPI0037E886AA